MKGKLVYRIGELFCGPGGLAHGAVKAQVDGIRVKHQWATDIDPDACETYRHNICPDRPESVICKPVQDLNVAQLDHIDGLIFGFPCNDFSIVGEHKGLKGKYGPLYTYGISILNSHRPHWFLAENVNGLHNANDGKAFAQILKDLGKAGKGYNVTAHLFKFEDYGVPQTRHRIVIVGLRKDLGLFFKVPAPTTATCPVTAKEILENPPVPLGAPNHELTRQSATVVERLKYIPPGENAWYEGIPKNLRLRVKGAKLSHIYRRLDPNKPAYTITGSGGGGTHVYHWTENRALTNRERARLQTFPDHFVFCGTKESVRKQIGMAVPPHAATIIVEAILKTLNRIPYKSISVDWDTETAITSSPPQRKYPAQLTY
jgi:DNA (cytosine-5)-methyltransferase 1